MTNDLQESETLNVINQSGGISSLSTLVTNSHFQVTRKSVEFGKGTGAAIERNRIGLDVFAKMFADFAKVQTEFAKVTASLTTSPFVALHHGFDSFAKALANSPLIKMRAEFDLLAKLTFDSTALGLGKHSREISEVIHRSISQLAECFDQSGFSNLSADAEEEEPELIDQIKFEGEELRAEVECSGVRVCAPSLLVLRRLFSKGVNLCKISWRDLEQIIGELLESEGYQVEVGRGTKDGGVDILAWKELPYVGVIRTVWQAKHLRSGNKVALSTIRELADIRDQSRATKGVIVTTGYLTSGALQRIQQDAYRLGKVDRPELERWIRKTLAR